MITNENDFRIKCADGMSYNICSIKSENNVSFFEFNFKWTEENSKKNDCFEIEWFVPMIGILYNWSTRTAISHQIEPEWCGYARSMLASNAPALILFDGKSQAKYTWAIDECEKLIYFKDGVLEENGCIQNNIKLHVQQYTNIFETTITLRIDENILPIADAASKIADWWANDLGMTPAHIPSYSYEPAYSFWYSYHQNVTAENVEAECRRAKELGFDVCIIDDGWQTTDSNRGYAYCGDWEIAKPKFPDMAKHVENVHKLGMKYLIWYSVPFMGYKSKHFDEFKDMIMVMHDHFKAGILDPRYKKVRDFLINIYKDAVIKYNYDGLKLDFIDQWCEQDEMAPYNPKMDIPVLQDAVSVFLNDVMRELFPDNHLIYNDYYGYFKPGYSGKRSTTYQIVKKILKSGARIDGVGIQNHLFVREEDISCEHDMLNAYHILEMLSIYSNLADSLHISEITVPSYDSTDEKLDVQAKIVENLYRLWFSIKSVKSVVWWNLVDGYAFVNPLNPTLNEDYYGGGLLRHDFSEKPAYKVIDRLVNQEWHTEFDAVSEESGSVCKDMFHGSYCISVNGKEHSFTVDEKTNVINITL